MGKLPGHDVLKTQNYLNPGWWGTGSPCTELRLRDLAKMSVIVPKKSGSAAPSSAFIAELKCRMKPRPEIVILKQDANFEGRNLGDFSRRIHHRHRLSACQMHRWNRTNLKGKYNPEHSTWRQGWQGEYMWWGRTSHIVRSWISPKSEHVRRKWIDVRWEQYTKVWFLGCVMSPPSAQQSFRNLRTLLITTVPVLRNNMKAMSNNTAWPIRSFTRFCWHQNNGCVSVN